MLKLPARRTCDRDKLPSQFPPRAAGPRALTDSCGEQGAGHLPGTEEVREIKESAEDGVFRSWVGEGDRAVHGDYIGTEVGDSFHLWQTVELGRGMAPTSLLGSQRVAPSTGRGAPETIVPDPCVSVYPPDRPHIP